MMQTVDNRGLRRPEPYEICQIGKYFAKRIQKEIKLSKTVNVIFTAIGLFSLGCLTVKPDNLIVGIIVGAISFGIAFWAVLNKKRAVDELNAYLRGDYYIQDAHITRSVDNSQQINRAHIWVRSDATGEESGFYEVYAEGDISCGAPVLMVVPDSPQIRKHIKRALTPYMMTDSFIDSL